MSNIILIPTIKSLQGSLYKGLINTMRSKLRSKDNLKFKEGLAGVQLSCSTAKNASYAVT